MAEETSIVKTEHADVSHDDHHDKTVFFGKTFDVPVYTFVFFLLGVATIAEVLLAEVLKDSGLKIPVLVGIAFVKAGLVMWYYMHLREDSRLFMWSIIIPAAVAMLSLVFLMAVPHTGY